MLDLLERQLADGRPFVLGPAASLADFSVYHPLWALRGNPAGGPFLDQRVGEVVVHFPREGMVVLPA
jgi:glutathione S-transferase